MSWFMFTDSWGSDTLREWKIPDAKSKRRKGVRDSETLLKKDVEVGYRDHDKIKETPRYNV